jgi:uncharacterized protein YbaR (Trm112 family)
MIMINKELLKILCCPEAKQNVQYLEGAVIDTINSAIKKGTLKSRNNQAVKDPIDAGLLREDRKYLYPVREDIPIMLIDEAIPFAEFDK